MGSSAPAIDWNTAQRIGELLAGSPPYGGIPDLPDPGLAEEFARRVCEYTGLEPTSAPPPLEMVDRPAWIAANLHTMRPLLEPALERLGASAAERDGGDGEGRVAGSLRAASDHLRAASGHLLGAQVGAVTGVLSQRVLGQYEVSLLDPAVAPRLLLLAPNLAAAARGLRLDRGELTAWVAIHEITHALQFAGAPWLREHLGDMLSELLAGLQIGGADPTTGSPDEDPEGDEKGGDSFAWLLDPSALLARAREGDLRILLDRARRGELLRIGLGEERWELVEQMQATMSLIEGHAEHTMDAVGEVVLPSLPRLRAAMTRRRESRGLPWRVLERLLGLELKLRQYEIGRQFCDTVVAEGGTETLAVAWRSPKELPTAAELLEPARWLRRMHVAA